MPLMKVLYIDLWKCYLSYVRETKGKLPKVTSKLNRDLKNVSHVLIYSSLPQLLTLEDEEI